MNMKLKRLMAFYIDIAIAALLAVLVNGILLFCNIRVITPMIAILAWFALFCKDCFWRSECWKAYYRYSSY